LFQPKRNANTAVKRVCCFSQSRPAHVIVRPHQPLTWRANSC